VKKTFNLDIAESTCASHSVSWTLNPFCAVSITDDQFRRELHLDAGTNVLILRDTRTDPLRWAGRVPRQTRTENLP
jgi:hypothetical protein